ncbi:MAG: DUF1553 domain-containing protein [Saprospiraceae bacterium]
MRCLSLFLGTILFGLCIGCQSNTPEEVRLAMAELPQAIDFNIHVKPILADRCFSCHGPDEKARKAGLRLDLEANAFALLESKKTAFSKHSVQKSEAIQRILSEDEEFKMPPSESNLLLSAAEKATLLKWVEQGAEWKNHWSFIPPEKPAVPLIANKDWIQLNPIDNFIQKQLESSSFSPNTPADREKLLRRVSIDLTGLPPTIEEMDAFLADQSPNAYEKVVDRLLNSVSYAERMAMNWLDLARYADSHGLHADGWRYMHPWRDWVIEAFNKNMPYDQFVTWQLAGDMMPNASREQKLATAFHRNHPMTAEGGAIDEEFRLEYVFDRTNTTATAILGLTMECARCHDHKFDPISQEEYYQLSAFFNNVKEVGMTGDDGNYGPALLLPSPASEKALEDIKAFIQEKSEAMAVIEAKWVNKAANLPSPQATKPDGAAIYLPIENKQARPASKRGGFYLDGHKGTKIAESAEMIQDQVRGGMVLSIDDEFDEFYIEKVGLFDVHEPFSASTWINTRQADPAKTQVIMGTAGNKNNFWRGWDFFLNEQNQLSIRLIHSLPHNYIQITTEESIPIQTWKQVAFTYDGSSDAKGLHLYINGIQAVTRIEYNRLYKNILPVASGNHQLTETPIRLGKSGRAFTGESGVFIGLLDEVNLFRKQLSPLEVAYLAGEVKEEVPKDLLAEHLALKDPAYNKLQQERAILIKQQIGILDTIPEVMVMEEMPTPRVAHVLNRGQYDAPTKAVSPATPSAILDFPADLPKNRLGLAQWLFMKENPLTARVAVNRYWQLFFGKGLVRTPQDFGNQGELPSHPELLDWLAVTFMESGWDIKALNRGIVLSATYRQSSVASKELRDKDPYNHLLARGPSHRWPAEIIRDNALAAAGLLQHRIGGPSVKPYQPEGLWIDLGNFSYKLLHYKQDSGDDLYRRSMYTFIRRTSPPPAMTIFDAPSREVCTVQREVTNTPLQALVLLNDPTYVEAARVMAERMQREGGNQLKDQLLFAFRLFTSRKPSDEELGVLIDLYQKEKTRFTQAPTQAKEALSVGEYPIDPSFDPIETAALTMVNSVVINYDEFYMKR